MNIDRIRWIVISTKIISSFFCTSSCSSSGRFYRNCRIISSGSIGRTCSQNQWNTYPEAFLAIFIFVSGRPVAWGRFCIDSSFPASLFRAGLAASRRSRGLFRPVVFPALFAQPQLFAFSQLIWPGLWFTHDTWLSCDFPQLSFHLLFVLLSPAKL